MRYWNVLKEWRKQSAVTFKVYMHEMEVEEERGEGRRDMQERETNGKAQVLVTLSGSGGICGENGQATF